MREVVSVSVGDAVRGSVALWVALREEVGVVVLVRVADNVADVVPVGVREHAVAQWQSVGGGVVPCSKLFLSSS